jgi:predicted nucleotidyltransferase
MDIFPEHRSIVLNILSRYFPDREIRVFGSRATGTAKPHSDLDLVIMGDEPIPVMTLRKLRDAFDDSELPFWCIWWSGRG